MKPRVLNASMALHDLAYMLHDRRRPYRRLTCRCALPKPSWHGLFSSVFAYCRFAISASNTRRAACGIKGGGWRVRASRDDTTHGRSLPMR